MAKDPEQQPSKILHHPRVSSPASPGACADVLGQLAILVEQLRELLPTALDHIRAASRTPFQDRSSVGFPPVCGAAEPAIQTRSPVAVVPPSLPVAEGRCQPEYLVENPPSSARPDSVEYCKAPPCSNVIPQNTKRKKYCCDECLKRAQRRRSAELKRKDRVTVQGYKETQQLARWGFFLELARNDRAVIKEYSSIDAVPANLRQKVLEGKRIYEKQYRAAHLERRKSQVREAVRRYRLKRRHR